MSDTTVKEALGRASFSLRQAGLEQAGQEAELLMVHCLQISRLQLRLIEDQFLTTGQLNCFNDMVARRCSGEPFAYLTGERYFYGRSFAVDQRVLIPRPETELLVERALALSNTDSFQQKEKLSIIDLGTGSGVLAITLALELPKAEVWAVDLSAAALSVARSNAEKHGLAGKIKFAAGNYFAALRSNAPLRFNLILANPPYITSGELCTLPDDVRNYEPKLALDGGLTGLAGYEAIIRELPHWLASPGALLLEIGCEQQQSVTGLCEAAGLFKTITCYRDLAGLPRVVEAVG